MKIVFVDSTNAAPSGPGSPAYFSRYLIPKLRELGHEVVVISRFDASTCSRADATVCEWVDHNAYEAAAAGVCKRLVLRMRGYEVFGPLEQLEWSNVSALVWESLFLKQLTEEKLKVKFDYPHPVVGAVIPSGVDIANIPFKERKHGPVVAMVGRGVADKGWQLAWEWAQQHQGVFGIQLHAAFTLPEPRLMRYLEESKLSNVWIYHDVDTVKWLDEIDANYLLSASNWESLGYTIAEAMACGVKPLVHLTPGCEMNWSLSPAEFWRAFIQLNTLVEPGAYYDSRAYRDYVERELNADTRSVQFNSLLCTLMPLKPTRITVSAAFQTAQVAVSSAPLDLADTAVSRFRDLAPARPELIDDRVGAALQLAGRYFGENDLSRARVWALRAMADEARPDALCLLGEIAVAEDDLEGAVRWYQAACAIEPVPSKYTDTTLLSGRYDRLALLQEQLDPQLGPVLALPPPSRYLVVVTVRNAENYVERCLQSVKAQEGYSLFCVVVDDASTDGTREAIERSVRMSPFFTVVENQERIGSLANIVRVVREHGRRNDVIVVVDGDDMLLPGALEPVDAEYRSGAWLTYGSFITHAGRPNWLAPYPQKVLRAGTVREFPWRVSHLKTFKKALFDHVPEDAFKNSAGGWFTTAGDAALMLPMLELAAERAVYIQTPIYVYNDENPENDHRVDPAGQVAARDEVFAKPKLKRLEKL